MSRPPLAYSAFHGITSDTGSRDRDSSILHPKSLRKGVSLRDQAKPRSSMLSVGSGARMLRHDLAHLIKLTFSGR